MNYRKISISIGCIIFMCNTLLNAQKIISVGLQVSPGLSSISSPSPAELTNPASKGGFTFHFGLVGKYYLDKSYGIASGIQLMNFKQSFTGNEYYTSFNEMDSENQSYERRVWGSTITESSNITFIHIPVHFFYKYTFNRGLAAYGSIGPGFSIPVKKQYSASGTFTYKGYYPEDDALLYDIPIYGFSSNVPVNVTEKLKTPFAIIDVGASIGLLFTINRYYRFFTAVECSHSITNVGKKAAEYHMSNEIGSFNSLLYHEKSRFNNVSFSIGITKDILY
jgi:hypothetical protein